MSIFLSKASSILQCKQSIFLLEDVKLFGCYSHKQEMLQLLYQTVGRRRWCCHHPQYVGQKISGGTQDN